LKWLVFSDVHLGSSFSTKVQTLYHQIIDLSELVDTIIINGDFFELWTNNINNIFNDINNIKLIYFLFEILPKVKKVVYVLGNHEDTMTIKKIQKLFPDIEVCSQWEYKNIIVIHGHQFHYLTSFQRLKGYYISHIKQFIEELFHVDLRGIYEKVELFFGGKQSNKIIDGIHDKAISYGVKNKKTIIMGHTHTQINRVIKENEITLYDCGESYKNFNYFIFNDEKMIEMK